jgi:hypothetical protein
MAVVEKEPEPADPETDRRREAELLRRLQAAGMIELLSPPPEPKPAGWQPLVLSREPLSETVTRMRREVP